MIISSKATSIINNYQALFQGKYKTSIRPSLAYLRLLVVVRRNEANQVTLSSLPRDSVGQLPCFLCITITLESIDNMLR